MSSELLSVLTSRGFIHQCTDYSALERLLEQERIAAYIGFDATAPSLHAGNLIQLMMLRWLQDTGHRPLVVIGGGTSQVGDPSGRNKHRTLLAHADIADNLSGIRQVFGQFLHQPEIIDNAQWLEPLGHLAFLRDVAKHFTVNRMLTFEMVRSRLDRQQPLSFLEFSYMLLQAYDFLELYRRYGCRLQLGGADQWGNIISGIELARRIEGVELYGLTSPLLTTASGIKMGKSIAGAVWLRPDWLSPYDYWQFWRNTQDQDVGRFLRLFTQLPLDEIGRLECLQGAELNQAKKILADEATTLCHGLEQSKRASQLAGRLFEPKRLQELLKEQYELQDLERRQEKLQELQDKESKIQHLFTSGHPDLFSAEPPSIEIAQAEIDKGLTLAGVLHCAGLASSKSAARRLIQGAGVQIKTAQGWQQLRGDTSAQNCTLLVGKKRYLSVRVVN